MRLNNKKNNNNNYFKNILNFKELVQIKILKQSGPFRGCVRSFEPPLLPFEFQILWVFNVYLELLISC